MATKLELYFSRNANPELESISFSHPLLPGAHLARRGSTTQTEGCDAAYRWATGVRAFCALMLRAVVQEKQQSVAAELSGIAGSLASTLDHAIFKDERWVKAMLGADSAGRPLARRAIKTENSRLRKAGPVRLSLNHSFLPPSAITVYLRSQPITSIETLLTLLKSLEGESLFFEGPTLPPPVLYQSRQKIVQECRLAAPPFNGRVSLEAALSWWDKELEEALSMQDLLNEAVHQKIIASLSKTAWAAHLVQYLGETPLPRTGLSSKLNIITAELRRKLLDIGGLDVFLAYPFSSSIYLLMLLRDTYNVPLKLHYCYEHAYEFLESNREERWVPETSAAVLTLGAAAHLSSLDYAAATRPLMFFPPLSHRVLACPRHGCAPDLQRGFFAFYLHPSGTPTGPNIYLNRLASLGLLSNRNMVVEPTEIKGLAELARRKDVDAKIIAWFPLYRFYSAVYGWTSADPSSNANLVPPLFYVPEKFKNNGLGITLQSAICGAWELLRLNSALRKQLVPGLLMDEAYTSFVELTLFGNTLNKDWDSAMFQFDGPDTGA